MADIPDRTPEELNLSARTLYDFITSDFESAWAALAAMQANREGLRGRGNMMFARQAMSLLEFACRLCGSSADARADFSRALHEQDARYFTEMPGACAVFNDRSVLLPFHPQRGPGSADRTLLTALFEMVRHGLAHQYQGITAQLADGRVLVASISGVEYGDVLGENPRRDTYLGYIKAEHDDLLVRLYPDVLYVDVRDAIARSALLERGLTIDYLKRGGQEAATFQFDAASVEARLKAGGHSQVIPPIAQRFQP